MELAADPAHRREDRDVVEELRMLGVAFRLGFGGHGYLAGRGPLAWGRNGYSPGRAPLPWRLEITPYGARGTSPTTSTRSTSPGRAPATWTGPVTTCGPSLAKSCGSSEPAIVRASRMTCDSPTPLPRKYATGSRPWSSRMPSCETVSKVTSEPDATVRIGRASRFGRKPHRTVSGVDRT